MSKKIVESETTKTNVLVENNEKHLTEFDEDTLKLAKATTTFIEEFYPSYGFSNTMVENSKKEDAEQLLNKFTFYRLCECKIDGIEDKFAYFAKKMQKLLTTIYSIKKAFCYGIVSLDGKTSIVIGINSTDNKDSNEKLMQSIIEGLLPGVRIQKYNDGFVNEPTGQNKKSYIGCISGVPALKKDGEYLQKDLSSIMRSLNGQNYTIMVMCKPMDAVAIQEKINKAISIKDDCYSISKRTIGVDNGVSNAENHSENYNEEKGKNETKSFGASVNAALPFGAAGVAAGAAIGTGTIPLIGTAVGAVAGGLVGLIVGSQVNFNGNVAEGKTESISKGYSDAITKTISENKSISHEIQNGFAIELMNMADSVIERLKIGRSIGMWESIVSYSSDNNLAHQIIQGSLYSEIASDIPEILPPVVFSYEKDFSSISNQISKQQIMIPKGFFENGGKDALYSMVTSEELSGICAIPVDNTVGFAVNETKMYSMNHNFFPGELKIGCVCEYDRPINNMPFGLSESDLNKHTFVSGITGCGKTNTVKRILKSANKHFLVIEPAKKEYRNINIEGVQIYTMGRPEINCLKMNPFYILPGVSPQQHIDLLKDLFSASFAFYGPMPYIVEKCLYRIYEKKGWDLTIGFHPYLSNKSDLFNMEKIREAYQNPAHRFLFPTMQDLKQEVDYYINNEMTYEGEVKGNIQAAIKARIDSLCVGTKGYIFNTSDIFDFDNLFEKNTVLELEGLADDSDKAFSLGLLIIYLNEYRQVRKELDTEKGLKHILVIEEAHRLLKNVSEEQNENLGNPKGKAVEHFTNMLAEMRSYGQGVIVAEQIPSKLAPDVVKNSSNKIVHRLVAKDDQEIIANTIGVANENAIYLGDLEPGYTLCHKEGMVEPVIVKIDWISDDSPVLDVNLYQTNLKEKMQLLNESIINTRLPMLIKGWAVRTLVSVMYWGDETKIEKGLDRAINDIKNQIDQKSITLVPMDNDFDIEQCIRICITNNMVALLVNGLFSYHKLPSKKLLQLINDYISNLSNVEGIYVQLRKELKLFYNRDPVNKAVELIAAQIVRDNKRNTKVKYCPSDYLLDVDSNFIIDVNKVIKDVIQ